MQWTLIAEAHHSEMPHDYPPHLVPRIPMVLTQNPPPHMLPMELALDTPPQMVPMVLAQDTPHAAPMALPQDMPQNAKTALTVLAQNMAPMVLAQDTLPHLDTPQKTLPQDTPHTAPMLLAQDMPMVLVQDTLPDVAPMGLAQKTLPLVAAMVLAQDTPQNPLPQDTPMVLAQNPLPQDTPQDMPQNPLPQNPLPQATPQNPLPQDTPKDTLPHMAPMVLAQETLPHVAPMVLAQDTPQNTLPQDTPHTDMPSRVAPMLFAPCGMSISRRVDGLAKVMAQNTLPHVAPMELAQDMPQDSADAAPLCSRPAVALVQVWSFKYFHLVPSRAMAMIELDMFGTVNFLTLSHQSGRHGRWWSTDEGVLHLEFNHMGAQAKRTSHHALRALVAEVPRLLLSIDSKKPVVMYYFGVETRALTLLPMRGTPLGVPPAVP